MHSPIDILAGGVIGNLLLLGWCLIDNYLDAFIISGENGTFLSVFDKGFIL
jgi:membrane-associated phospholipid phosphatase